MSTKCPICSAGEIGVIWTEKFLRREITLSELAKQFGCSKQMAHEHVKNHYKPSASTKEAMTLYEYYQRFHKILADLDEWISVLKSRGKIEPKEVQALVALIKEYRNSMMDLAELEGKIQRGQVIVQIQEYNSKLDEISRIIVEELCDDCRDRVLARLESVLHV